VFDHIGIGVSNLAPVECLKSADVGAVQLQTKFAASSVLFARLAGGETHWKRASHECARLLEFEARTAWQEFPSISVAEIAQKV
jgi:hypothetical protein